MIHMLLLRSDNSVRYLYLSSKICIGASASQLPRASLSLNWWRSRGRTCHYWQNLDGTQDPKGLAHHLAFADMSTRLVVSRKGSVRRDNCLSHYVDYADLFSDKQPAAIIGRGVQDQYRPSIHHQHSFFQSASSYLSNCIESFEKKLIKEVLCYAFKTLYSLCFSWYENVSWNYYSLMMFLLLLPAYKSSFPLLKPLQTVRYKIVITYGTEDKKLAIYILLYNLELSRV